MLGKLKDLASSGALDKAISSLTPVVTEQLTKLQALGAEVIGDDPRFTTYVIEPAYMAVVSASHGVTKLIPEFKDRFAQVMVRLRDELVVVEGSAVRLVEDFKTRVPQLLKEVLKS